MIGEMLIRIEKLEDEIQDLNNKIKHLEMGIVILIKQVDPKGYEKSCVDLNDDNVS